VTTREEYLAEVERLASEGLDADEILALVRSGSPALAESAETLEAIDRGHLKLKAALKQELYKKAVSGKSTTALMWLSKQYLGWSEKNETKLTSQPPVEVTISYVDDDPDAD
jgi:alkyl sulfatase BDS1-like metallo-beta-lactamase superfamily hydrolase